MGCVSLTDCIVAMVQKPDDGAMQPMENSPPGIHTMPSGALAGAGVMLGTVAANGEALVAGATASAATAVEIFAAWGLACRSHPQKMMAPSKTKMVWFGF